MKHAFFPFIAVILFFSCATAPRRPGVVIDPGYPVMGAGTADMETLVAFFRENNPEADEAKVYRLARLYREEAAVERVNADVAFIQMCLETGFLRFGNLVTEDMNNFCGLGAIGPEQPGLRFPDERTGVRAHVQHLQAYGSTEPLAQELVDPRYKYVSPRGKAATIGGLGGTWAADRQYGEKLAALLTRLYNFPVE
ncbi:MAG TPA: glucosaminidase domain-containing protein [Treponemataceae bacterium]|nr:glucosaminidase domain-containing protein [Treponemataceae bacterium]HOS35342.1 glucosaminidase domain-containing protein [Treponemataceae bacterium]HPL91440.1 glucosaminidase domain-containing protein [Treponemataceae bacterium]HRR02780.1 glucosaminidase domain-containing protein [Treponemataceae bacterium]